MKPFRSSFIALVAAVPAILLGAATTAPGPSSLDVHLEPLRAFVGKTWKGPFANSTPEKPVIDVQRWERALNGTTIRILHSINDGAYGGETLMFWDESKQAIVYFYFTTAGYYTTGTITPRPDGYTAQESVTGSAEGVTEVRSIGVLGADGTLVTRAEYLKNGAWVPGHEVTYREDAAAQVTFK